MTRAGGGVSRKKNAARKSIPQATQKRVLRAFRGRCAMCGDDQPQLHHIDNDRSNSADEYNLLPLCSRCHLTDVHDPTAPIDRDKLLLFRKYRDPSILASGFEPLFRRIRFVLDPTLISGHNEARWLVNDLRLFLFPFVHGAYYSAKITGLLAFGPAVAPRAGEPLATHTETVSRYRSHVTKHREQVIDLIVEMLRYQRWAEHAAWKRRQAHDPLRVP
jgi:hypothetical protein